MLTEIDIENDAEVTCEYLLQEQDCLLGIIAALIKADCGVNGGVLAYRHRPTAFKAVKLLANYGRITITELKRDSIRAEWIEKED